MFYLFSHVLCIFSHVCPTCFQSLYVLCVFSLDCIAYPYMCCGYFHMHNTHFNRCVVHIFIFIMYISHSHCTYLHIMHIFICIMHIIPHVIHIFICVLGIFICAMSIFMCIMYIFICMSCTYLCVIAYELCILHMIIIYIFTCIMYSLYLLCIFSYIYCTYYFHIHIQTHTYICIWNEDNLRRKYKIIIIKLQKYCSYCWICTSIIYT